MTPAEKAAKKAHEDKIDRITDSIDAATNATGDPVTGSLLKIVIIMCVGAVSPVLMIPAAIVAFIL